MDPRRSVSLGHVHLKVRDLERAVDFYANYLGLALTERDGPFAFLSWGDNHHTVALQEIGPQAAGPTGGVGLYHVAFEVEDRRTLREVYLDLRADGIPVSPIDHGISEALYFSDPDGNGIEVYLDTRSDPTQLWEGRSKPFDPEHPDPDV